MKKRIYKNMLTLIILCIVFLSVSMGCIFFNVIKSHEQSSIRDRAVIVADLLNRGINEDYIDRGYYDSSDYNNPFADFISDNTETARMTIISPDGTVLLDNKTLANTLENHSDREEFIQACKTGTGEATRQSDTFGGVTYYYAIQLDDGNILRISKNMGSISEVFTSSLPAIILVTGLIILLANLIARKLTSNIIKPLYAIDFEGDNPTLYDEFLPYVEKINEQKKEINQQLSALQYRADTINTITGNMKEGLLLIDKKGLVLSANPSALDIFKESTMIDKSILHICRDAQLLHNIELCLNGKSAEMSLDISPKNYQIYLSPVYSDDEINGAIILFLETTEKHKAEKQRREFSANVTHELKTPLTTISALSEMIESGMVKEEDIKDFASKISRQTKRLINIIDDIIKISEFDEGNIDKNHSAFDIYELAGLVITDLRDKADGRHVDIQQIGKHMLITANMRMMDELLYNLIDNAIKYNKDGGRVKVEIASENGFCKISVSDTGIGILKKHQNRVFERFYRVDKSRSKRTGGTGLGLAIVKHIVEYHNGRIELESTADGGTTIICYIKQ